MKSFFAKIFAAYIVTRIQKEGKKAVDLQQIVLSNLIRAAENTAFGSDHHFKKIQNHADFTKHVPIREYEGLKDYVERVKKGEKNVLWPGLPLYFAKTSGTTSGAKYIPISEESISNHIHSARNALLCYIHETGKSAFVSGKMIFLQGSPELEKVNGINVGRLSGIVAHHVPKYLTRNRMPSFESNCIDDWETKVDAIAEETAREDMRLISGIPPWLIMYFDVLKKKTGKSTIGEIFPNFSLMVFGGVNFKPYQKKIEEEIGRPVDSIELYPASEGFIAYQDKQSEKGMLLNINSGIFFEFVKPEEMHQPQPKRLTLAEVEMDVNYALILSNNAGLWAYSIGDTIKFTSLEPPRIVVTGRIKHFTSAFGEHVIAEEVEDAIRAACENDAWNINEFHLAPMVAPSNGELPFHEWFIEFEQVPEDLPQLAKFLDEYMQKRNTYYRDLREGNILQQLKISPVHKGGFSAYMKSVGKLGGQNKLPRLANDRNIATGLENLPSFS